MSTCWVAKTVIGDVWAGRSWAVSDFYLKKLGLCKLCSFKEKKESQ
jgi:hypothetical protein